MLRLIAFLIVLVASVWLGIEMMRHPGYLLLVYQPWMVQMPIWFAILAAIFIFITFYLIINSFDRLQFFWFRMKNWLRFRKQKQQLSKTEQGYAARVEQRFKLAEQLLVASVSENFSPLINYLEAARAAHAEAAYERRDQYLQKAYEVAPNEFFAIGLTQAELEFNQQQSEHAIATLLHLKQKNPKHPGVLRLLEKIYVRMGDWEHLRLLIPDFRKARLLSEKNLALLEKNTYCEIFNAAYLANEIQLKELWAKVPRNIKKQPDVVASYVKQLQRFANTQTEIEELIRRVLKNDYQAELVTIYGDLNFTQLNQELIILGNWLKHYGQRAEILLSLGKLCVKLKLWGKAKDYFVKCLSLGPNPKASLAYGQLMEILEEKEQALMIYRHGLDQVAQNNLIAESLPARQL